MHERLSEGTSKKKIFFARLESEAKDFDTHEAFVDSVRCEENHRSALVAELRDRVSRGDYQPNVALVAERILADVLC